MNNPFNALLLSLPAILDQAAAQAADTAAERARSLAPVETGALRASISASGNRVSVLAPYAACVEYGTAKQSARAFLRPAAAEAAEEVKKRVAEEIGRRF